MTGGTSTLYGILHGPQPLLLQGYAPLWAVALWSVIGFAMGSLPVAVLLAAACGYAISPERIVTALGAVGWMR